MTRINCGISPTKLCDKHLLAEHREIKRIPNTIKSGKARIEGIPEQFTLGSGHVKFFYNKLLYLKNRYDLLYEECCKRGFNVTSYHDTFIDLPKELMFDYSPTKIDMSIVEERLEEKMKTMKDTKLTYVPGWHIQN